MENNQTDIIDWDHTLQLAGGNTNLANDMLTLLIKSLPEEVAQIKTLYHAKNITALINRVHKLHGALCYCRLPRLKKKIAALETDLKTNIMDSSLLVLIKEPIDQLDDEVSLLTAAMAKKLPMLTGSTDKNG